MTSKAGTSVKSNVYRFTNDGYKALESKITSVLKETFRPEFLNRIDEMIVFTELSKTELKQIIELMLKEVREDVEAKGMSISVTEAAKEFILDKGYDVKYGARPLRRTIQKCIEDELSEAFLKGNFKAGSSITVDVENGEMVIK
jgi:ATP-dependent Clp protease ATP-binding subunit ClpE